MKRWSSWLLGWTAVVSVTSCVAGGPALGFRAGDTHAPGLRFPTTALEGSAAAGGRRPTNGAAPVPAGSAHAKAAGAIASGEAAAVASRPQDVDLPDPPVRAAREQLELTFEWARGVPRLVRVDRLSSQRPVASKRLMGRFAVEQWIGDELLERVRFDFPGLDAEAPPSGRPRYDEPVRFDAGLQSVARVRIPVLDRTRQLVLVDRATRQRSPLRWPLTPGVIASAAAVPAVGSSTPDATTR